MFYRIAPAWSPAVRFLLAGLVVVGGCGRGGDPARPTEAGRGADGDRVPPVTEFLGWGERGPGDGPTDRVQRQERLVQEIVAECMRAKGFEYVPEQPLHELRAEAGPFSLSGADFARQYGYGITTIDASDLAGPQADPNRAIVDALSPQAQEAYRHALYGQAGARPLPGWIEPLPGAAPQGTEDDVAVEDAGCYQNAQDEVYGPAEAEPDGLAAAFAELNEELTALQNRIDRDPRVEAARTEWAGCMAEAGHAQYTGPNDPPEVIRDRFTELTGLNEMPVDGRAPGVAETEELLALRDHERAVAQADLACRAGYDETVTEVRFELEEEFVSDHRDLLERYRELAGVAGGAG